MPEVINNTDFTVWISHKNDNIRIKPNETGKIKNSGGANIKVEFYDPQTQARVESANITNLDFYNNTTPIVISNSSIKYDKLSLKPYSSWEGYRAELSPGLSSDEYEQKINLPISAPPRVPTPLDEPPAPRMPTFRTYSKKEEHNWHDVVKEFKVADFFIEANQLFSGKRLSEALDKINLAIIAHHHIFVEDSHDKSLLYIKICILAEMERFAEMQKCIGLYESVNCKRFYFLEVPISSEAIQAKGINHAKMRESKAKVAPLMAKTAEAHQRGDYNLCLKYINDALSHIVDADILYFKIANLYKLGRYSEIPSCIDLYNAHSKKDNPAHEKEIKEVQELVAVNANLAKISDAYDSKDYILALGYCEQGLSVYGTNPRILGMKIFTLYQLERYEELLACIKLYRQNSEKESPVRSQNISNMEEEVNKILSMRSLSLTEKKTTPADFSLSSQDSKRMKTTKQEGDDKRMVESDSFQNSSSSSSSSGSFTSALSDNKSTYHRRGSTQTNALPEGFYTHSIINSFDKRRGVSSLGQSNFTPEYTFTGYTPSGRGKT